MSREMPTVIMNAILSFKIGSLKDSIESSRFNIGEFTFLIDGRDIQFDFDCGLLTNMRVIGERVYIDYISYYDLVSNSKTISEDYITWYDIIGVDIYDITAEYLSKVSKIIDFGFDIYLAGDTDPIILEDLRIDNLYFKDDNKHYSVDQNVLFDWYCVVNNTHKMLPVSQNRILTEIYIDGVLKRLSSPIRFIPWYDSETDSIMLDVYIINLTINSDSTKIYNMVQDSLEYTTIYLEGDDGYYKVFEKSMIALYINPYFKDWYKFIYDYSLKDNTLKILKRIAN